MRARQEPEPGECQHFMDPAGCADCKNLAGEVDPYQGVLIARFTTARYSGPCPLVAGHRLIEGTRIGLAVDADDFNEHFGWCCAECVEALTALGEIS